MKNWNDQRTFLAIAGYLKKPDLLVTPNALQLTNLSEKRKNFKGDGRSLHHHLSGLLFARLPPSAARGSSVVRSTLRPRRAERYPQTHPPSTRGEAMEMNSKWVLKVTEDTQWRACQRRKYSAKTSARLDYSHRIMFATISTPCAIYAIPMAAAGTEHRCSARGRGLRHKVACACTWPEKNASAAKQKTVNLTNQRVFRKH